MADRIARKPPTLPPVNVAMFDASGTMNPVWRAYFVDLSKFHAAIVAALNAIP